jgi:hypothetical protein
MAFEIVARKFMPHFEGEKDEKVKIPYTPGK